MVISAAPAITRCSCSTTWAKRCRLRPGNVHSADGWQEVLVPVVERYKKRQVRLYFRGVAAFASPDLYEYLEAEDTLYAIRLPANKVLHQTIVRQIMQPRVALSSKQFENGREG